MKKVSLLLTLAAVILLAGCVTDQMDQVHAPVYKPTNRNESLVIFMRPSMFGGAIQASLFDGLKYIGTISEGRQIAYQTKPGKHMFMVLGESADFMQAYLLRNKTYYAVVTPRIGFWKARFSLRPQNGQISQTDINKWLSETTQVSINQKGLDWYHANYDSIVAKRNKYLSEWQGKSAASKQTLRAKSGV